MKLLRQSLTKLAVIWALAIVFLGLTATTNNFFSVMNLRNILDQQAFVLIIAGFATIVIISGGFDVSLGAILYSLPNSCLKGGKRNRFTSLYVAGWCGSWHCSWNY